MSRFLRVLSWIYAACCVVALALVPISAHGWLGVARDPLAGIFALLFGLPWSLLLRLVHTGTGISLLLLAAGMVANIYVLRWLSRRFA